jgi:hypothetical protein
MMNSLEMNNIEEIKTLNPYQQEAVLDESPGSQSEKADIRSTGKGRLFLRTR